MENEAKQDEDRGREEICAVLNDQLLPDSIWITILAYISDPRELAMLRGNRTLPGDAEKKRTTKANPAPKIDVPRGRKRKASALSGTSRTSLWQVITENFLKNLCDACPKLVELHLVGVDCPVIGRQHLMSMPKNLRYLSLAYGCIEYDLHINSLPGTWSHIPQLEALNLAYTSNVSTRSPAMTSFIQEGAPQLRYLSLRGQSRITRKYCIVLVRAQRALRHIDLAENRVYGLIDPELCTTLATLPLHHIDLSGCCSHSCTCCNCDGVGNACVSALVQSKDVLLQSLRCLLLGGTAVDDACIDDLKSLPNLKYVWLYRSSVSEQGLSSLRSHGLSVDTERTPSIASIGQGSWLF